MAVIERKKSGSERAKKKLTHRAIMKISEKTERVIEVEFDDIEMATLHRIEEAFGLDPKAVVGKALAECIRTADSKIANFHNEVDLGGD
jgi:uncharacterized protein YmfQ (DUF2313 family)